MFLLCAAAAAAGAALPCAPQPTTLVRCDSVLCSTCTWYLLDYDWFHIFDRGSTVISCCDVGWPFAPGYSSNCSAPCAHTMHNVPTHCHGHATQHATRARKGQPTRAQGEQHAAFVSNLHAHFQAQRAAIMPRASRAARISTRVPVPNELV